MRTKQQKKNNPRYKNIHAPKGKHWCSYHQQYEPKENFVKNRNKVHGLENRCKEGFKEYRKNYDEKFGDRNQGTKTLRVFLNTHTLVSQLREKYNRPAYEIVSTAIKFYLKYGCMYPGCIEPRSHFSSLKCHTHKDTILLSSEERNVSK